MSERKKKLKKFSLILFACCIFINAKSQTIDKIVAVKFNEVICDRNGDYSLFLPRLVEIREDKEESDDFQKIKNL